jgi:hypothetical protein
MGDDGIDDKKIKERLERARTGERTNEMWISDLSW